MAEQKTSSGKSQKLLVGPRLRRFRQTLGLTQARMAEDLSISTSYLNLMEHNQRALSAKVLLRMAEIYDFDEEEEQAKELELDGDDIAVIGGASGKDDDQPGYDGYSEDEDEDEDAALVVDEDNELPPPDADDTDDDDVEEVEI